jgi:quinoprotein glucose dehydrogenase
VTGKPIWPIEERPVPESDVPGERTARTQPFPTRPAPLLPLGVSLDDAFDLTPELKAAAQAEMKKYRIGPFYTPPSLEGTILRPGILGGANWGGGAFDPETARLYVKTSNTPSLIRIVRPDRTAKNPRASEVDGEWTGDLVNMAAVFSDGIPVTKPPYGHLTALDLNEGVVKWQVPFGDSKNIRDNPALKGVALPDQLGVAGPQGALATKGGLVFVGGGDMAFHAYDTDSGRELMRLALPRRATATPMTYRTASGRQFVVIATGVGGDTALMAFAPGAAPSSVP